MKRFVALLVSQQGSAMVMALMIFLIISGLAAAIINVATLEDKIAFYHARKEQARQLADGGIQVARNVLMNYRGSGYLMEEANAETDIRCINSMLNELSSWNIRAEITGFSFAGSIATIESTGTVAEPGVSSVSQTVQAKVMVNGLPSCPLRSRKVRIMGRYFATIAAGKTSLVQQFISQDWDPAESESPIATDPEDNVDNDTDIRPLYLSYPLHGQPYRQFDYSREHPYFTACNHNNSFHDYTWWVGNETKLGYEYIYKQRYMGSGSSGYWEQTAEPGQHDMENSRLIVAPFYKPAGILDVENADGSQAPIAMQSDEFGNEILTADERAALFDDCIPRPDLNNSAAGGLALQDLLSHPGAVLYPDRDTAFNSADFLRRGIVRSDVKPPEFNSAMLDKYRELSQQDSTWQYIPAHSSLLQPSGAHRYRLIMDSPDMVSSKFFIDLDPDDTVELDFTSASHYTDPIFSWNPLSLNDLTDKIMNQKGTFFNAFRNRLDSIIAVSPANLYAGIDSFMLDVVNDAADKKPAIFLLSGKNIDLLLDPVSFNQISRKWTNAGAEREIRIFILAGGNARITSTLQKMTCRGILSVSQDITFLMDYFAEDEQEPFPHREIEKNLVVIKDTDILRAFPEPWAYMGEGAIVSYKYID